MYNIKEITFEKILHFWQNELWPGRLNEIQPASAINSNGEIDIAILV